MCLVKNKEIFPGLKLSYAVIVIHVSFYCLNNWICKDMEE